MINEELIRNLSERAAAKLLERAAESNACQSYPCWFIYGIIMPICGILGLILSSSTFVTLCYVRRTVVNVLLFSLFSSEALKSVCATVIFGTFAHCRHPSMVCEALNKSVFGLYPLAVWANTVSTLVCVAISIDRYIATTEPFRMYFFSRRRSFVVLSVIYSFSAVFAIPLFFELEYNSFCRCLLPTELRRSKKYQFIYYFMSRTIVGFALPCIILISTNILLIQSLIRFRKLTHSLGIRFRISYILTMGCVAVVCGFLLTNILAGTNHLLEYACSDKQLSSDLFRLLVYAGNALVVLSPSINSIIYCGLGSRFRQAIMGRMSYRRWEQEQHGRRVKSSPMALSRRLIKVVGRRASTTL